MRLRSLRIAVSMLSAVGLYLLILEGGRALADSNIVTQTFNIGPTPCEGLSLDRVTYSFTVAGTPNLDCNAGTFTGPAFQAGIQAPNIEGTAAGVLHLTFDVPTTKFGFSVAQNTYSSPQSVVTDLFRPGNGLLRQEIPLVTTNDPGFVGARFDYSGPAVKTVTIRFTVGPYSRFVMDNVSYFRPPGRAK
jgi:hypothetical protein